MSLERSSALSLAARLGAIAATSLLVAGCVTAGAGASPTPSANPSTPATPAPATPAASSSAAGFYLRLWRTQALAPQYTFNWLPDATISDGQFIDGMVAVPAIYPGPLWIDPSVQSISAKGIDTIVAEARKLGLLGDKSDFIDTPRAGSVVGHIKLIVDGKTFDLSGESDAAAVSGLVPAAGTSAAFSLFWQEITGLAQWLPGELGLSAPYEPERLALLAQTPKTDTSGIKPNEVLWPLATPFASFGSAMGSDTNRCAVVSGADLAKLEPLVKQSNQLTLFVDNTRVKDSLQVRVLVPGEQGPCA